MLTDRHVLVLGDDAATTSHAITTAASVTVIAESVSATVEDLAHRGLITLHQRSATLADIEAADVVLNRTRPTLRQETATSATSGRVTLVGAGPGDPGLVTVAGAEALAQADVIVTDRLVPYELLRDTTAEVIDVAKVPGGRSTPQDEINRLLIEHAAAGRHVVRFKGGDNFVFGRGGEEVEACADKGIEVRVIPGVSSAIAAPALAGVPITHRGVSQGFCVISGHVPPGHPDSTVDYAALAQSGLTIVALMAVRTLPQITGALIDAGLAPSTPAAVIVDAGLASQRALKAPLSEIADASQDARVKPPAVTVIGAVVDQATI